MSAIQSDSETQTPPRFDNSRRGVIIVGAALALLAVAVLLLWLQVMPPAPAPVEKYLPLPNGASFVYRVTQADGQVHYRARNVYRAQASHVLDEIDPNLFGALTAAAGMDVLNDRPEEAALRLPSFQSAVWSETEYSANGSSGNRAAFYTLVLSDSIEVFAVNGVPIEPALPVVAREPLSKTITGLINREIPYSYTFRQETVPSIATALGEMRDCMRVMTALELNKTTTTARTVYCPGVGEVLDETYESGAPQPRRSEIIVANVNRTIKGSAPFVATGPVNASPQYVFADSIGTGLQQVLNYREHMTGNDISTQIVPVQDVLLYGTARGALVALDAAAQRERWRFQTGGAVYGTPIVMNGIVYFGSADKKVYAVRFDNGAFLWAFETGDVISLAPAANNETLFAVSEDRHLYALDLDTGKPRWNFLSGAVVIAAPVVQDGVVYVGNSNGVLSALDAATGAVRWKFVAERAIAAPVTIQGDRIFVTSYDGNVYALDRATGAKLWYTDLHASIVTPPVVAEGRVLVALPAELIALDAVNGATVWRYSSTDNLLGAPIVTGNQVWQLTMQNVIGLDAATGAQHTSAPSANTSALAGLSSDGRMLYAGFFGGDLLGWKRSAP